MQSSSSCNTQARPWCESWAADATSSTAWGSLPPVRRRKILLPGYCKSRGKTSSMPASDSTISCNARQGTFMPLCLSFPRQKLNTPHVVFYTPPCLSQDLLPAILVSTAEQSSAIQGAAQHPFNQEASAKGPGQHFRAKRGHLWHKLSGKAAGTAGGQAAPAAAPNHRAPPNPACSFRHPSRARFSAKSALALSSPDVLAWVTHGAGGKRKKFRLGFF